MGQKLDWRAQLAILSIDDSTYSTPFLGVSSDSWFEPRFATDIRGTGPSGPAFEAGADDEIDRRAVGLEGPAPCAAAAATLGTDWIVDVWNERVRAIEGLAARPAVWPDVGNAFKVVGCSLVA